MEIQESYASTKPAKKAHKTALSLGYTDGPIPGKGSHYKMRHPETGHQVTIAGASKDENHHKKIVKDHKANLARV